MLKTSIRLLTASALLALTSCGGHSDVRSQPSTSATAPTTSTSSSPPSSVTLHPAARDSWASPRPELTSTGIWTVDLLEPDGQVLAVGAEYPGLLVTETDPDTGAVLSSGRVTTEDLKAAALDLELVRPETPTIAPAPLPQLGNLAWDGVADRTLFFHTPEHLVGIDADTGRIRTLDMPPASTFGPPGAAPYVGALGDSLMVVVGGVVSRIDLEAGAITEVARVDVADPQAKFGPDAIWIWGGDPSTIVRVDADGSTHRLDQFTDKVIYSELYPGTGLLWAIVVDGGTDPQVAWETPPDPAHPAQVVGLDRNDGHRVAEVPPQPPQGHLLVAFHDGLFAETTPGPQWHWVDNAGTITELTPRAGVQLLGAVGERIAYWTPAEVGAITVTELLAAGNP